MKKIIICLLGLVLMVASGGAGDEQPWFDMENCAFCKHLTSDPGLLQNTTWEHHNIKNGIISVTTVQGSEHLEAYFAAGEKMQEESKKMMNGEQVPMCNMCQAMGGCMAKGLACEMVNTKHGSVAIFTSDKPELYE